MRSSRRLKTPGDQRGMVATVAKHLTGNPKISGVLALVVALIAIALAVGTSGDARALGFELRVNTGGAQYTDSVGNIWQADQGFNTGEVASTATAIAGTSDPTLFQSERWDPNSAPELQYAFPVADGVYEVNLYFADIYTGTHSVGARVFDVTIEGILVLDNLDIYSEAGGKTYHPPE